MSTACHMAATTLPEFQCNELIAILSSLVTLPEQEFQALGSECLVRSDQMRYVSWAVSLRNTSYNVHLASVMHSDWTIHYLFDGIG